MKGLTIKALAAQGLFAALMLGGMHVVEAQTATACTLGKFCYCVNTSLNEVIAQHIAYIRGLVREQRALGKSIGYMSIPLSSVGGGNFAINAQIAAEVKQYVENRLGDKQSWIINPAAKDIALPPNATGADYMLMWTQVLEGENGFGDDFDFVSFVGPSAFARHFGLDGHDDMRIIDDTYDKLAATDAGVRKIDKRAFRNYYALRASVSFSYGAHDEWNIVQAINQRRRADKRYGLANQLPMWFDGQAVEPVQFETTIAPGYVGACEK
jgi:hypothetical protein